MIDESSLNSEIDEYEQRIKRSKVNNNFPGLSLSVSHFCQSAEKIVWKSILTRDQNLSMTIPRNQVELTNWSKSTYSNCYMYQVRNTAEIIQTFEAARSQGFSVVPHGAGHSYTDAALNSNNIVMDTRPMCRILAWDSGQGIMRAEPGVPLKNMAQMAWKDGWWPVVAPSTAAVTIGGCAAMNVNGRNAWKFGPFGSHIISLDVMFTNGEQKTILPGCDTELFRAVIGSLGLLGVITSITVQLQHIYSSDVIVRKRSANSLAEIFALFTEEESGSDFMEAWLDGFARDNQLGRGYLTSATFDKSGDEPLSQFPAPGILEKLESPLVAFGARMIRPILLPGVRMANQVYHAQVRHGRTTVGRRSLYSYTFWPSAAFAGSDALFAEGVESFQAFVPKPQAREIFEQVLSYSQEQGCMPLWCVIKQHQRDPFLLSYQVDGLSLELNYQRTHQTANVLKQTIQHMIATVIDAGGRFYFAKDHFLTPAQYRQSVGDESVDHFLRLKRLHDPETLLQSDLFRRIFQPAL